MRRRDFITLLGGAAALPLAARAQQPGRIQRIGVLSGYDDPAMKAFQQELERLGWSEGRNVHIEYRYAPAGTQLQPLAQELVALQPDVIFAQSRPVVAALQAESHTIPIVFTAVIDPIGAGFIASVARPGSNMQALWFMSQASSANGSQCSRRSRRIFCVPLSWAIPRRPLITIT
jgi:putative tryptophan/tyrosine transport system substrate-binding protein